MLFTRHNDHVQDLPGERLSLSLHSHHERTCVWNVPWFRARPDGMWRRTQVRPPVPIRRRNACRTTMHARRVHEQGGPLRRVSFLFPMWYVRPPVRHTKAMSHLPNEQRGGRSTSVHGFALRGLFGARAGRCFFRLRPRERLCLLRSAIVILSCTPEKDTRVLAVNVSTNSEEWRRGCVCTTDTLYSVACCA